jgi:Pyruvate/2-oxoacid:ferredoxin oxidoreductase gamma subunit
LEKIILPSKIWKFNKVNESDYYPEINHVLSLLNRLAKTVIKLDALQVVEMTGNIEMASFFMLGALIAINSLPMKKENIIESIKDIIPDAESTICINAINLGISEIREK